MSMDEEKSSSSKSLATTLELSALISSSNFEATYKSEPQDLMSQQHGSKYGMTGEINKIQGETVDRECHRSRGQRGGAIGAAPRCRGGRWANTGFGAITGVWPTDG